MSKVRVAIIGVGNCASSLVQGIYYYRNAKEGDIIPGIMHTRLGSYHIGDIEFSFGIDIDKNKVGKDLAEAIYTKPNNTFRVLFVANYPESTRSDRRYRRFAARNQNRRCD
jgi:myo-inositol-1-phosphate synthase